ncbi:MAG: efflux RND transporter permease subunit [Opitutales bacterium]|nr:efflux RND transporter permease subunit [Opitutales bacterium]
MKIFSAIIKYCLANRFLTLALAVITMCGGVSALFKLPVDILPNLDKSITTIVAEASGYAPEEVEKLVAIPIENALAGLNGVKRIRTANSPSLSLINIDFDWNADTYNMRQLVQERLQTLGDKIPENVSISIAPIASVMGEIIVMSLGSENPNISPIQLRTIADYDVARRLSSIEGVSQVLSTGGGVKQYRIIPDLQKMASLGITIDEICKSTQVAQNNTGGGIVSNKGTELTIRNIGRSTDINDIANAVVRTQKNAPILIKDVAQVRIDKAQLRGDAAVNGKNGIVLTLTKQPNTDTLKITKAVENAIAEISKTLPEKVELKIVYRQDDFINTAISNVEDAIRDGAIMVFVILFIFLFNVRTTLITIIAIPSSFAIALIYFYATGSSINTMTLGGLAVAVGMLVDDAIVDVENVYRRLRENATLANKRNPSLVILDACVEIRASIFYATAIIVIVFLPTLGLSGIEGRMFRPLAEAVIVSMIASFIVALTLVPVLCSLLLKGVSDKVRKEPFISCAIKFLAKYLLILPSIRFPKIALFVSAMLTAMSFALLPMMGRDFIPPLNEGSSLVILQLSQDSSIERSNEIASVAEKALMRIPEIKSIARKIGRAEGDDHAEPVNIVKFNIEFNKSKRPHTQVINDMRKTLDGVVGITYSIGQPMAHRLDYMLSGIQSQIAVKVYGKDLDVIASKAEELASEIKKIKGAVDVNVERQNATKQIRIEPDREKIKLYGIKLGDLNNLLQDALGGKKVADVLEGDAFFDVFVRLDETDITNVEKISQLLIPTEQGAYPLSSFAKVIESAGPNQINREKLTRRIAISLNVSDISSVELAEKISNLISEKLGKNPDCYAVVEGQFQSRIDAETRITILFAFAMLAIFALLLSYFKSINLSLQILLAVPIAFAGGIALTWYFIGTMSVASLVGIIALAGIASRNTIMLVSHYLHLMNEEGESFDEKMILRGTLERLNPILMTALTAGFALIPLMYNPDSAGKELLYPVSVMIVGGLFSSTLLSIVVTPAVFKMFGRSKD